MTRSADNEPHEFVEHLLGLPAPTVSLPCTTYADSHDEIGPAANMSLADLAAHDTLVVYFFPSEDEGDGRAADTMSRVYRDNDGAITQLGARTVGVSTETVLEQQRIAGNESFHHLLLADEEAKVAKDLDLPTVIIDERYEYEPLAVIIRAGKIVYVAYPIASPSRHIDRILRWLTQDAITVPATLASCVRDGLYSEMGNAAEQVTGLTEHPCERSIAVYREPLRRLREAQLLLEEIGGETPIPPMPFEVDVTHRPVLISTLKEQRQSYSERLDDLFDAEKHPAAELIKELDLLISANEHAED